MRDPATGDRIYLYTIQVTHLAATTGDIENQYTRTLWARTREEAIQTAWDRDPYAHRFEDITEDVALQEELST